MRSAAGSTRTRNARAVIYRKDATRARAFRAALRAVLVISVGSDCEVVTVYERGAPGFLRAQPHHSSSRRSSVKDGCWATIRSKTARRWGCVRSGSESSRWTIPSVASRRGVLRVRPLQVVHQQPAAGAQELLDQDHGEAVDRPVLRPVQVHEVVSAARCGSRPASSATTCTRSTRARSRPGRRLPPWPRPLPGWGRSSRRRSRRSSRSRPPPPCTRRRRRARCRARARRSRPCACTWS